MQAVLEVALGLGFVFLLFSTVASAVVEWISAVLERRPKMLRSSLNVALGPELANELLAHPIVAGVRAAAPNAPPPSYLPPRAVALALADLAKARQDEDRQAPALGSPLGRLRALVAALRGGLPADAPNAVVAAPNAVVAIDGELLFRIERWFGEQMDRTTGVYKRWTQVWTFAVALTLTLAFDLDAGRIAADLHRNAAVRSALASQVANEIAGKAFSDLNWSVSRFDQLPVGWTRSPADITSSPGVAFAAVGGWTVTIIALGLGAPFWFDALNRIASIRQTGPRPGTTQ